MSARASNAAVWVAALVVVRFWAPLSLVWLEVRAVRDAAGGGVAASGGWCGGVTGAVGVGAGVGTASRRCTVGLVRIAVVDGRGVLGYAGLWVPTGGCAGPPPGPGHTDGADGCGDAAWCGAAARCTGGAAGDAGALPGAADTDGNGACGDAAPGARPNGTDGVDRCAPPGEATARCTGRTAGDAGPAPDRTGAGDTDRTGGAAAAPNAASCVGPSLGRPIGAG